MNQLRECIYIENTSKYEKRPKNNGKWLKAKKKDMKTSNSIRLNFIIVRSSIENFKCYNFALNYSYHFSFFEGPEAVFCYLRRMGPP